MCKLAYTSYEKILTDIQSYLRGSDLNNLQFLDYVKVIDDIVIDLCPLSSLKTKINQKFTTK